METANAPNAAPLSLLEELSNITNSAANLAEQSADTGKAAIKLRRKSKDLCEVLEEIHDEVESLAEAASVFRSLGGFKKVRRNSKDLGEDTLRLAFNAIDADGGGTIDRDELRAAINREREKPLEEKQLTALMNFADSDGNGEIDFEEYKQIMTYSSGM